MKHVRSIALFCAALLLGSGQALGATYELTELKLHFKDKHESIATARAMNEAGEIVLYALRVRGARLDKQVAAVCRSGPKCDLVAGLDERPRLDSANDINDIGQIAGFSVMEGNLAQGWLREPDGSLRLLESGRPGVGLLPNGLNNAGVVVGNSSRAGLGESRAFAWKNGQLTWIPGLGQNTDSAASRVNDSGRVVGASNLDDGTYHGFTYDMKTGILKDIGTIAGSYSDAYAVNSKGDIAGGSTVSDQPLPYFAMRTVNGVMQSLGGLPGSIASGGLVSMTRATWSAAPPMGPGSTPSSTSPMRAACRRWTT